MGVRVSGKPKWATKRGMGGWQWSGREDRFIQSHADKQAARWIADQLGRTLDAVYTHAKRLGFRLSNPNRNQWNRKEFLSLDDLIVQVRHLGIESIDEYRKRYKEVAGAPSWPPFTYSSEWAGWPDLLGRQCRQTTFLKYDQAKKAVKALDITGQLEYQKRYKEHPGLPALPQQKYKKEWNGWADFTSTVLHQSRMAADKSIHKSVGATRIHDFMFGLNIRTVREFWYGPYRADWFLPDFGILVEFFGMVDGRGRLGETYRNKTRVKLAYCRRNGLRLVGVYPKDIETLGRLYDLFKDFIQPRKRAELVLPKAA